MKKLISLAIVLTATLSCLAQTAAEQAKDLYKKAETLDKEFRKGIPSQLNPNAKLTPEAAKGLLEAMDLYAKVMELDQQPDEKGKVKPKYTEKIKKSIMTHSAAGNFARAGGVLFGADMKYPEAYEAFMTSGMLAAQQGVQDSVYSIDFVNAGKCAFGTDYAAARDAFEAARKANTQDIDAYKYEISSINILGQNDSTYTEQAKKLVDEVAEAAYKKFGASDDYLFSYYVQIIMDRPDYPAALAVIDEAIAANPSHDNSYRLRGIVNYAQKDYMAAAKDFTKMSGLTSNFGYMRDAIDYLNRCGKFYISSLETVTPEQKAEVISVYENAIAAADKAKAMEGADPESIDYLLEDINYNLENARKR